MNGSAGSVVNRIFHGWVLAQTEFPMDFLWIGSAESLANCIIGFAHQSSVSYTAGNALPAW